MQYKLSFLIASRNEMFLKNTVEDILKNKRGDSEIIVGLDGNWSDPPLIDHPDVTIVYVSESVGQREITNICARLSKAKYVCKIDAHVAISEGWDVEMIRAMEEVGDDVTMVSIMRNLWAFSWKCYHCGWKKYQGPTLEKCEQCGKTDKIRRKMMWIGKHNPQSTSYCFDSSPHFQYFEDWKHRPQYIKDKTETGLTETMSLQGSCWMVTRDKYWELNLGDENFGSWGSQGLQISVSTWLSGGRVLCNHKCWYAHMFRTKGGTDFGFPYPQSGRQVSRAKQYAKKLLYEGGWPKQIYPASWLLEKFSPIPGWSPEQLQQLKLSEKQYGVPKIA